MGVFISHIAPEAHLAAVLKKWIEDAFLGQADVFVSSDHDDITAGDQWFQRIGQALGDAKVLLVICSTESVHRPWINFETGAGHMKEVPIIPICHTGMTKTKLPKPLLFFQALDADENDFSSKLMAALTKHLAFPREPRIPYQEMKDEVHKALSEIADETGYPSQELEMGFLDHSVKMEERIAELTSLMTTCGEDARDFTIEIRDFVDRKNEARSSRYLRRVAKEFGIKGGTYAQKVELWNEEYQENLSSAEQSIQYVMRFQKPKSEADWEAVDEILAVLESSEKSFSELKNAVVEARRNLRDIPNYQEHMTRSINKIISHYGALISNLDSTLEMFRHVRLYLNSLQR